MDRGAWPLNPMEDRRWSTRLLNVLLSKPAALLMMQKTQESAAAIEDALRVGRELVSPQTYKHMEQEMQRFLVQVSHGHPRVSPLLLVHAGDCGDLGTTGLVALRPWCFHLL